MNKNNISLVLFVFVSILVYSSTYTLSEFKQAIIIQLGEIKGEPVTKAGLHWKIPFIQKVLKFDKRILQWDGDRGEIPTKDKKFIWVDTTARWRIEDALMFYRTLRDENNALSRMGTILEGITKDTVSNYNLIEIVRNSNAILQDIEENKKEAQEKAAADISDTSLDEATLSVETISVGREKISQLISQRARRELKNFGLHLTDVQIRSIAYKEVVEKEVYKRMISEREKIAEKIRSTGMGEKAKIMGQLALQKKKIQSDAYRKIQEIKGKAEAEAIDIYATSLKKDPDFFSFLKTMETYKKTLVKNGSFLLSTDNEFLKLLSKGVTGK